MPPKIACLGWGSLIWDQRELPVRGKWFEDGVILPIEFLRTSKDGRLTLVIDEKNGTLVRTLWTLLDCKDLDEAKEKLREREETTIANIDSICVQDSYPCSSYKKNIYDWAKSLDIDAVVWTALPSKFEDTDNKSPSLKEAVEYLSNLSDVATKKADEYIRKTPKQIDTNYRREFVKQFGWTHE